jgi:hypothetical protein
MGELKRELAEITAREGRQTHQLNALHVRPSQLEDVLAHLTHVCLNFDIVRETFAMYYTGSHKNRVHTD